MRMPVLFAVLLLSACGYHLRGQVGMPFDTLYLSAVHPSGKLAGELRHNLTANKVALVGSADQADIILSIDAEAPDKQILSLGGSGRVNEFQLYYRVSLRAYDNQQRSWIPAEEMVIRRDYSFDDTQILAKEQEELLLFQSMRSEMVQHIMRRLSRARPQPEE